MHLRIFLVGALATLLCPLEGAIAQTASPQQLQTLLDRLAAQDARIQQLESKVQQLSAASPAAAIAPEAAPASQLVALAAPPAGKNTNVLPDAAPDVAMDMGGHSMDLRVCVPTLKIRGFFDFNFGGG